MALKDTIAVGMATPQAFLSNPIDMEQVRTVVQRAEALGFRDLWTTENTFGKNNSLEPSVLLSYAAALTTTIRLGVSVVVFPFQSPIHIARRYGTLDQVSNGRVTLGLGIGRGDESQYTAFGLPYERRVTRFTEGVELMKALWTKPVVDFKGEIFQLEGATMEPKPIQKPHIPIWMGGAHPAVLKRTAAIADGWMGAGGNTTKEYPGLVAILRQELEAIGRDPATFPTSKRIYVSISDKPGEGLAELTHFCQSVYGNGDNAADQGICGTPEEVREQLEALVAATSPDHLLLHPVGRFVEHVEAVAEVVGLK
ncbi:MAG: LLM class flavin-dependent oxidoreductase [Chloroflexi bacterium]|nr:LLM class flavin-dependent oxidoreductase [Chloroflexota bacterium]